MFSPGVNGSESWPISRLHVSAAFAPATAGCSGGSQCLHPAVIRALPAGPERPPTAARRGQAPKAAAANARNGVLQTPTPAEPRVNLELSSYSRNHPCFKKTCDGRNSDRNYVTYNSAPLSSLRSRLSSHLIHAIRFHPSHLHLLVDASALFATIVDCGDTRRWPSRNQSRDLAWLVCRRWQRPTGAAQSTRAVTNECVSHPQRSLLSQVSAFVQARRFCERRVEVEWAPGIKHSFSLGDNENDNIWICICRDVYVYV